jgi:hypothetical protein
MQHHKHVKHPKELLKKDRSKINKFNDALALQITTGVGTMWSAYIFCILALASLPAVLTQTGIVPKDFFPSWLVAVGLIALVAWIAQTFLQLVLLPVIIVGQNLIQSQNDAKAEVDHETLTYLATLQDEQMKELEGIKRILSALDRDEAKIIKQSIKD